MGDRITSFKETYVETFMGGVFSFPSPPTVGQLRAQLAEIESEISSWGDDLEIAEVALRQGEISILLEEGIVQ